MATLAGTVITRVRGLIPDPVYAGDTPQPDADGGLFRASLLYGWLDDGVKLMSANLNWTLADWTAMAFAAGQPIYPVDPLWTVADQVYAQQRRLKLVPQSEAESIYPNRSSGAAQNMAYVFRFTDHVDLGVEPVPTTADSTASLATPMALIGDTLSLVAAPVNFYTYGFVRIDSELIQYAGISGNQLVGLTRGAGGTTAALHTVASIVTHCGLWVKGMRVPRLIVDSLSLVEVPLAWVGLLNHYVLGQALESQQETQRAESYMGRFERGCQRIAQQLGSRDPITGQPRTPEPPAAPPVAPPPAAQAG